MYTDHIKLNPTELSHVKSNRIELNQIQLS